MFIQIKKIKFLAKVLSRKETLSIKILSLVILTTLISIVLHWYFKNSYLMPAIGGEYIEGIVGNPNLINPILTQTNEADIDLTRLIFTGLFIQQNGNLTPNLVKSYTISSDGLTYTFVLRDDVLFHDGNQLTAEDVVFTVESIQNAKFNSPLLQTLTGIRALQKDSYTVIFTLTKPFAPFLSMLTFGILPKHIWEDIPPESARLADFNIKKPIGTGPFKIKSFKKDSRGVIKSYTLTRNENFYRHPPYLNTITLKFYPDTESAIEALNNKNIDGIHYLPKKYKNKITNKKTSVYSLLLQQYYAIFFNNQQNNTLKDIDIRNALNYSLNKEEIVRLALDAQGEVIYGPILPGLIGYDLDAVRPKFSSEEAAKLIQKSGWKKITIEEYQKIISNQDDAQPSNQNFFWQKDNQILTITLTTVQNTETAETASIIQKQWRQAGIKVNLKIIPKEQFMQNIIAPRNYEALLFGNIIGSDPDPYAFWHSSQIADPGVNLALYKNEKVDALLEEARKMSDAKKRAEKYAEFQKILQDDIPAIFIYNPTYPYGLLNDINGFNINRISTPSDRFNGVENWYIKTKRTLK